MQLKEKNEMLKKAGMVPIPEKCPECGDSGADGFGEPYKWVIEDEKIPAKWVMVVGWYCEGRHGMAMVFGTAVRRGPVEEDGEIHPMDIWEDDVVYLVNYRKFFPCESSPMFPGRTFRCEGPYYGSQAAKKIYENSF